MELTRDRFRADRAARTLAVLTAVALMATFACSGSRPTLVLTDQVEARRLAAEIRVQFAMAADAANRAVMADTDEASKEAADEAINARTRVGQDIAGLEPILKRLDYPTDVQNLEEFKKQFDEYKKLDDETLNLAVENTNVKAQQLSFTNAQKAVDEFRQVLEPLPGLARPGDRTRVQALCAQAIVSVLSLQVIQAHHIAEAQDAAMTKMEEQMANDYRDARKALADLQPLIPEAGKSDLSEATAALNQLKTVNDEIVRLSRRNTNVRSLALALGQKHSLRAKCEAALQALTDSLAQHEFKATR